MKSNVPWDVAWSLPDDWRLAALVTFGELEGNDFNWSTLRWMEKSDA